MNQEIRRASIRRPNSNKTPSPDFSSRHQIKETKTIHIDNLYPIDKKPKQRIPLLQEVSQLTAENQKLKSQLSNFNHNNIIKELESKNRELEDLRNQLKERNNKKLNLTLIDQPQIHKTSIEKNELNNQFNGFQSYETDHLQAKILELSKQNEQLKKTMIEESKTFEFSLNPSSKNQIHQQIVENLKQKMNKLEAQAIQKISFLEDKITYLQNHLKKDPSRTSSFNRKSVSKKKLSIVSPQKRQSTATGKRESVCFVTPTRQDIKSGRTIQTLEGQLSSSKNNIRQLQQQKQDLLKQTYSYKKAYEQLIKNQSKTSGSNHYYYNPESASPNQYHQQLKQTLDKIERQNHDLRLKNTALQKAFKQNSQVLNKAKLTTSQSSDTKVISPLSENEYLRKLKFQQNKIQELLSELESTGLQKAALRRQLFSNNIDNSSQNISQLQQQNNKLNQQIISLNTTIQGLHNHIENSHRHSPSNESQLMTYFKKRVQQLQERNRGLQMQLETVGSQQKTNLKKQIQRRQHQIQSTQQQLNQALYELHQSRSAVQEKQRLRNELGRIKEKLDQADQMIRQASNMDISNKNNLKASLRDLQSIQRMVESINFTSLEQNLRELGEKIKQILQKKIEAMRLYQTQTIQLNRIASQNDRLRKQVMQLNSKFVNERSLKQKTESLMSHQGQQVRILQEQVNYLNSIINSYIPSQSMERMMTGESEESKIRQLDSALIEDHNERNILQVKEFERQLNVVSSRIGEVITTMNLSLHEEKGDYISSFRSQYYQKN